MAALVVLLLLQDPALLDRIAADEPAERAAVREAIRKTADRDALLKAVRARETRAVAALALGVLGAAEAREALVSLSKDREPAVRARALEAVGHLPDLPVEMLLDALSDADARAAFAAARSLGRADARKVQPRLFALHSALLGAKKREVRFLAVSLALEGLAPGTQWYTFYASANDVDAAYASAALLGLLQVEKTDTARASGVDFASGFRGLLARGDLGEDARAIAATLWLRLGAPAREDLYAFARDRDARVRSIGRRGVDGLALTKLDVGGLIELLAQSAKLEGVPEWIGGKLRELTGHEAAARDFDDHVREWRLWWEKNRETALAEIVAQAVERGAEHLRRQAQADGTWKDTHGQAGITALAVYTMLKCGSKPDALEMALDLVMKAPFEGPPLEGGTYRAAAVAMAASEAGSMAAGEAGARYRKRAHDAAAYLVRAQRRSGSWGYGERDTNYQDNSNAQFAVLGIRSAQNVGAKVPAALWARAAGHFASSQMSDGGWGYTREQSYGSMTAAGLCGLLLSRSSSRSKSPAEFMRDKDVASAIEWIGKNWTLEGHRYKTGGVGSGIGSAYYWLWTFERCALVAGLDRVGGHDWWSEGAAYVIGRQGEKGEWTGPEGLAAHCFALLFLKRAYVPVATTPDKDE